MKGSAKILLAALMLFFLFSAMAEAQELYTRPVIRDLKIGRSVVKFDRVFYYFKTPLDITVAFERIDDRYVELVIKPTDEIRIPYVEIGLWWDDYPINTLILGMGGDNSWTLDSETGYAEK